MMGADERPFADELNGGAHHDEPDDDRCPTPHESGVYGAGHTVSLKATELPLEAPGTERAVLGGMMRADEIAMRTGYAKKAASVLTPDHFGHEPNRQTFIAIVAVMADGYVPDLVTVMDRLQATNRLVQVGAHYLTEVLQWAAEVCSFEQSLEVLDDVHRRRRFLHQLELARAHTRLGVKPIEELLEETQASVVELASSTLKKALPALGTRDLSAPLGPIPWLVPALKLAPGAITIVAGSGYSRKTLALQSLALSVASGRPVWGLYGCRRGSVLHLDYEQGERLTRERYQRLARGLGFELAHLPNDALQVACMPDLYLDGPGAEATLTRACQGRAFVLVDSMRAACPHTEENSSDARAPIDLLNRVSERTGAVVAMIHHAKKPQADGKGAVRDSLRGSSAIFDACAEVYVFTGQKGQPTDVHHEKDRITGETMPDFGLDAVDLSDPATGAPRWGLRVVHLEAEQLELATAEAPDPGKERRFQVVVERTMKFIVANPGTTHRAIRESVEGAKNTIDAAVDTLIRAGKVEDRRSSRGASYYVA